MAFALRGSTTFAGERHTGQRSGSDAGSPPDRSAGTLFDVALHARNGSPGQSL